MKVYYWSKVCGISQSRDLEGGWPPIPTVEVSEVALRRVNIFLNVNNNGYFQKKLTSGLNSVITNSVVDFESPCISRIVLSYQSWENGPLFTFLSFDDIDYLRVRASTFARRESFLECN